MNQQDYHCSITANVTTKEAFNCINRVSDWWTNNLEGSSQKNGDIFTVRFGETFATLKIIESVGSEKVVWHVTDCYLHWLKDKKEWLNTKMEFVISNKNNATQIDFTHIGLLPKVECYNDCVKGWDQYVKGSLFKLITEGKGNPEGQKASN